MCFRDTEFVIEEPREDEVYEDEDDENEEGNWRNDYPDMDPDSYPEGYSDLDPVGMCPPVRKRFWDCQW